MRTLLLSLLSLTVACGPAWYQGPALEDTCDEADTDTDSDSDSDTDSDTDADTDVVVETDPCEGAGACLVFETSGGIPVDHIYGHIEIYESFGELEYAYDNASWASWSATETWSDESEIFWAFDADDLEAVRYNFSLCDGDEDTEWDENHCTWHAYGRTSAEARFVGDSELIVYEDDGNDWDEDEYDDFDPELVTFCWDSNGDGTKDECGSSALAGPGVDDL